VILKYHLPLLFDLIRLRPACFSLEIEDFFHYVPGKDVVTSPRYAPQNLSGGAAGTSSSKGIFVSEVPRRMRMSNLSESLAIIPLPISYKLFWMACLTGGYNTSLRSEKDGRLKNLKNRKFIPVSLLAGHGDRTVNYQPESLALQQA
jgi:hypothetical protein